MRLTLKLDVSRESALLGKQPPMRQRNICILYGFLAEKLAGLFKVLSNVMTKLYNIFYHFSDHYFLFKKTSLKTLCMVFGFISVRSKIHV